MQYYGTTAKISDDVQLKIDQMIENVSWYLLDRILSIENLFKSNH